MKIGEEVAVMRGKDEQANSGYNSCLFISTNFYHLKDHSLRHIMVCLAFMIIRLIVIIIFLMHIQLFFLYYYYDIHRDMVMNICQRSWINCL